jgi:hypothetical protein
MMTAASAVRAASTVNICGVPPVRFARCAPAQGLRAMAIVARDGRAGVRPGLAYGMWAASGVALTAVGARVFFKDGLTKRMGAGIALIAVGVLLIELGAAH